MNVYVFTLEIGSLLESTAITASTNTRALSPLFLLFSAWLRVRFFPSHTMLLRIHQHFYLTPNHWL